MTSTKAPRASASCWPAGDRFSSRLFTLASRRASHSDVDGLGVRHIAFMNDGEFHFLAVLFSS